MRNPRRKLIAIVGGSGAGKSWLADQLQQLFGTQAARLSLDDFYHDRSHLPLRRRDSINFDHPRSIDWPMVESVLHRLESGRAARAPQYDFSTHARAKRGRVVPSKPVVIMDGLWLLRRPAVRRFFAHRIFIDCPKTVRLQQRISRDVAQRGRGTAHIKKQFLNHVAPMHDRYVASQYRWATIVLRRSDLKNLGPIIQQLKNS